MRAIDGVGSGDFGAERARDRGDDDGVGDGHYAVEARGIDGGVCCHFVRREGAVVDADALHRADELVLLDGIRRVAVLLHGDHPSRGRD